jgi:hypothetical protein
MSEPFKREFKVYKEEDYPKDKKASDYQDWP